MEISGYSNESGLGALCYTQVIELWSRSMSRPDPNILLFRRPLGTDGTTGLVNPELAEMQKKQFRKQFGLE